MSASDEMYFPTSLNLLGLLQPLPHSHTSPTTSTTNAPAFAPILASTATPSTTSATAATTVDTADIHSIVHKRRVTYCVWGQGDKSPTSFFELNQVEVSKARKEGCFFYRKLVFPVPPTSSRASHTDSSSSSISSSSSSSYKYTGKQSSSTVTSSGSSVSKNESEWRLACYRQWLLYVMDIHPDKEAQSYSLLGQDNRQEEGQGAYDQCISWAEAVISSSSGSSGCAGCASVKDNNTYTHNPLHKPYTSTYQPRQQYTAYHDKSDYNRPRERSDDRGRGQNYDRPSKKRENDNRDRDRDGTSSDSYRDQKRHKY